MGCSATELPPSVNWEKKNKKQKPRGLFHAIVSAITVQCGNCKLLILLKNWGPVADFKL